MKRILLIFFVVVNIVLNFYNLFNMGIALDEGYLDNKFIPFYNFFCWFSAFGLIIIGYLLSKKQSNYEENNNCVFDANCVLRMQ